MSIFGKKEQTRKIPLKKFKKGELIIHEGDHAICMFDIIEGKVGVYKNYGSPNQKEIAILKAGDYFGEMAVIENQPRNATIAVLEDSATVQVISADDFNEYIRQNPNKIMLMLQNMGRRIHTSNSEFLDACETIYEVDKCYMNQMEPGRDLSARIKMYSNRYQKNKK